MLTRRSFTARAALAAGACALAPSASVAAPFASAQGPGVYRFPLGRYQITALYDGTWFLPIDGKFVRNASGRQVNRALAAGFLLDNLKVAGVAPDAIDTILISHFHPDHIDGIKTKDGAKVFPKAEIWVPEPEWRFWMDDGNEAHASGAVLRYFRNARRIFTDIAKDVHRFTPGADVAPGIVSIPAYGHTPGHTAFAIHSEGQSLLVMSDTVRNPYLFARHPDWQPIFDMDGALAVKARRRMLDRAAADRMLVEAYHFPFPACGHMVRTGTGFELVPVMWRPL